MRVILVRLFLIVVTLAWQVCTALRVSKIYLQVGKNIGHRVKTQIIELLSQVPDLTVQILSSDYLRAQQEFDENLKIDSIQRSGIQLQLFLGDATLSEKLIKSADILSLPPGKLLLYQ